MSSFSRWPAGRAPATYAFERLPSQQANPQAAEVLEDSARRAVEAAGFVPAAEGAVPDVSVQIGARITATERSPFDDPFWYGPYGWGPYRPALLRPLRPRLLGPVRRPVLGTLRTLRRLGSGLLRLLPVLRARGRGADPRQEERRAALRSPGQQRRHHVAARSSLLPAMFSAALQGFPSGGPTNPRRVKVDTTTATPCSERGRAARAGPQEAPSPARARSSSSQPLSFFAAFCRCSAVVRLCRPAA